LIDCLFGTSTRINVNATATVTGSHRFCFGGFRIARLVRRPSRWMISEVFGNQASEVHEKIGFVLQIWQASCSQV
jgi:hypothetical protein